MRVRQRPYGGPVHRNRVELETPTAALAVVSLVGEHDLADYEALRHALDLAAARRRHLIVDLTGCEFIDSTVVSLLLHAQGEIVSDGGRFALVVPPSGPVCRVAEVMHFAGMFPMMHGTCAAAVACTRASAAAALSVADHAPAGP
jgi:anti-sigma B factor antagonist